MSNSKLAAAAWNAVRRPDDAPWANLSVVMKGRLLALAEKYATGAKVHEGDYPPEGFAEKVWQLATAPDVISGDQVISIESPPKMAPHGLDHAEHEDTRTPSPTTEDVDPLKAELEHPAPQIESESASAGTASKSKESPPAGKRTPAKKKAAIKKAAKNPSPKK